MEKSENFSTSSENSTLSDKKAKIENKLLKIILNTIMNFSNGYWVHAKYVTKKGPKIFIKQLNSCTSYHKSEKNHTFTNVIYIPEAGCAIIKFLNSKMASQFFYERQGVNWQNQTDSDSESDSEENEGCQNFKNCQNRQKTEDFQMFEEFEENDGEEESEEGEESQENDDEKNENENAELGFCTCEIEKIELDQNKLIRLLKKNLKKIKSKKKYYYFFLFKDTENAENYFRDVYFN